MRFTPMNPVRRFSAGFEHKVEISDCGRVELEANEQITFTTPSGGEYDVVRKDWGFYATPSTNGRLATFGLRAVLVRNRLNRCYVLLVESDKIALFEEYMRLEKMDILTWLDKDEDITKSAGACL